MVADNLRATTLGVSVFTRRIAAVVVSTSIALSGFGIATSTAAWADVTPQDQKFLETVKQLEVPVQSDEDAIAIGHEICKAVDAGKIEPARTVRGVMSRLQGQGLEKKQAVNLVWGAVAAYCPQFSSIVGR
jgi:hypothetical protein